MNLRDQIASVDQLFGPRNRRYIGSRERHFLFLLDTSRIHLKMVRRGVSNKEIVGHSLASMFGWTCALAHTFGNLPIVEMLSKKYPMTGCSYCQMPTCICTLVRRNECRPADVNPVQLEWSIRDWSNHIKTTYGKNNESLSTAEYALRLEEEIIEILRTLIVDLRQRDLSAKELDENIASEFADTICWIIANANRRNVDLQAVVEEIYNGNHDSCGNRPCTCGEVDWAKATTVTM